MAARVLPRRGFQLATIRPGVQPSAIYLNDFRPEAKELGASAMDIAKRLLAYGVHSPTTVFPVVGAGCLLIEPTETETKAELGRRLY